MICLYRKLPIEISSIITFYIGMICLYRKFSIQMSSTIVLSYRKVIKEKFSIEKSQAIIFLIQKSLQRQYLLTAKSVAVIYSYREVVNDDPSV